MGGGQVLIGVVVIFGVIAAGASFFGVGGSQTYTQRGASGLPERIFFALFGAPRDREKEARLSWTRTPGSTRPPARGFQGNGASRRW